MGQLDYDWWVNLTPWVNLTQGVITTPVMLDEEQKGQKKVMNQPCLVLILSRSCTSRSSSFNIFKHD